MMDFPRRQISAEKMHRRGRMEVPAFLPLPTVTGQMHASPKWRIAGTRWGMESLAALGLATA